MSDFTWTLDGKRLLFELALPSRRRRILGTRSSMQIHLVTVANARAHARTRVCIERNFASFRAYWTMPPTAIRKFYTFVHMLVHTLVTPRRSSPSRAHTYTERGITDYGSNATTRAPRDPRLASGCLRQLQPSAAVRALRPDVTFHGKNSTNEDGVIRFVFLHRALHSRHRRYAKQRIGE